MCSILNEPSGSEVKLHLTADANAELKLPKKLSPTVVKLLFNLNDPAGSEVSALPLLLKLAQKLLPTVTILLISNEPAGREIDPSL